MIDENDAPEGYKAVADETNGCRGCHFDETARCPLHFECEGVFRADGHSVIFIKREGKQ